jgi:hypothetical protein
MVDKLDQFDGERHANPLSSALLFQLISLRDPERGLSVTLLAIRSRNGHRRLYVWLFHVVEGTGRAEDHVTKLTFFRVKIAQSCSAIGTEQGGWPGARVAHRPL